MIKSLRVAEEEHVQKFELRDKVEVGAFLRIQIKCNEDNTFYLTQLGIIKKVLTSADMEHSKTTVKTPASYTPLG